MSVTTAPSPAPEAEAPSALEAAYRRYHAAWEANDPERIADLHSADSVFWMHDGSAAIEGRENLRRHYRQLFEQYESLVWESGRVMFGEGRWLYDYTLLVRAKDAGGAPFTARIDMVDVVHVNADQEVTWKEVFVDSAATQAARRRAGTA